MNHKFEMKEGEIDNQKLKEVTSRPRYPDDYQFAQSLLSGDSKSWDRFYNEFRKKLESYINRKYPNFFSPLAVEEICDGVGKRLMGNDFKAIRDYRGECTFSSYITKATEWEIKDWLRKHSEELLNEPMDSINENDISFKSKETYHNIHSIEEREEIPEPIKSLSDDLRWAFLLRYYDYFGFPLDEIRLLAKKKGVSIGSITSKIIKFLEPEGEDILHSQREKQKALQMRIQKLCFEIHKLDIKEHQLLADEEYSKSYNNDEEQTKKTMMVRDKRLQLEKKREDLLKNKSKFIIITPYEVIAEILNEDNVSTIRSRVFFAKKQLAEKISKKDE